MDYLELFKELGIFGIMAVGFVWILRFTIKQLFAKDLEKFKYNLEKETISYKTKFEKLHTERALVIKEIYKKIVITQRAFISLTHPFQPAGSPSEEERAKDAAQKANELTFYFEENRIYFEEDLAIELNEFMKKLREIWYEFNQFEYERGNKPYRKIEAWNKAWDKAEKDIPEIKKKIEKRFRTIIGIE